MSKNEPKQVIIIRKDLNMRKGKMVAQGCHASLSAVLNLGKIYREHSDVDGSLIETSLLVPLFKEQYRFNGKSDIDHAALTEWLEGRFTKICVSVNSEQELVDIIGKAEAAGLITSLITDAGLTEFNGVPTITCGAIGPAFPEDINPITSHLPLL